MCADGDGLTMWILIFLTSLGSSEISTFPSQAECIEAAKNYNKGGFRDEIFYCEQKPRNKKP